MRRRLGASLLLLGSLLCTALVLTRAVSRPVLPDFVQDGFRSLAGLLTLVLQF
ncbi:MAG TPA: hypothetical protein PK014_04895 [Thermoanaerobaculia bacterium]|nr:hypothetical protein [Thermoanaerobaculia bacterium]HUM29513.1 hypothetical protein [Thermoanaerobaculia bacterium]HXK67896.1 hypothetical protein [Thermoanaerobaculia bacterium]